MSGRITSISAPAVNVHGVPYKTLLEREREASARLLERYRLALEAWLRADEAKAAGPNSRRRKILTEEARDLTARVLT